MAPLDDDDREILMADAKTATLAGGGIGMGVLGVLAVPLLSVLALALSFFALKTARPGYRVGRITAIAGIVLNLFGLAAWITLTFVGGA